MQSPVEPPRAPDRDPSLDILSGAAAQTASNAVPPVQEHADASKSPPPAKRARKRSKLEKAVDDLATQNVKLNTLLGTLEKALALVANAKTAAAAPDPSIVDELKDCVLDVVNALLGGASDVVGF